MYHPPTMPRRPFFEPNYSNTASVIRGRRFRSFKSSANWPACRTNAFDILLCRKLSDQNGSRDELAISRSMLISESGAVIQSFRGWNAHTDPHDEALLRNSGISDARRMFWYEAPSVDCMTATRADQEF